MPSSPSRVNPFVIGHHAEGDAFCNRWKEVERIARAFMDPSARLLVHGDRRLGKSSAIHQAADRVRLAQTKGRQPLHLVVVDLAAAPSAPMAAKKVLDAVQKELGRKWKNAAQSILTRLTKGTFSLSASTDMQGQPSVSFQMTPGAGTGDSALVTDALDAIEAELGERKQVMGLGLDEFQRLGKWYGPDFGWQLKEMLERHRHIAYVLAGSENSIIEQMVDDKKAPLNKVVEVCRFAPIDSGEMAAWLSARAAATGVTIALPVAAYLCALIGPRTRDIVQLARAVWGEANAVGAANMEMVRNTLEGVVREQSALHQRVWDGLTETGRRVLAVHASKPEARLLAEQTLFNFALGSKSTVQDAITDLLKRELLVRRPDAISGFDFDDPYFRRWIQTNAPIDGTPPLPE